MTSGFLLPGDEGVVNLAVARRVRNGGLKWFPFDGKRDDLAVPANPPSYEGQIVVAEGTDRQVLA